MNTQKTLMIACLCFAVLTSTASAEKKHMVVVSGMSSRQINNHPWSYTSSGQANTNCSGSAVVNGTASDAGYGTTNINGAVNATTNCNTTYTPPQTTNGNVVTVENASWITDITTGDQYLIQCTAHWRGSKCSYLTGGRYEADLEGNSIWISGMKGMKKETAKYSVLQYIRGTGGSVYSGPPGLLPGQTVRPWAPDEVSAWQIYQTLSPLDQAHVRDSCKQDPEISALVPKANPIHAVDCKAWISASNKAK